MAPLTSSGGYIGLTDIGNNTNVSALCFHNNSAAISLILSSGIGSNNIFEFFRSNRSTVFTSLS